VWKLSQFHFAGTDSSLYCHFTLANTLPLKALPALCFMRLQFYGAGMGKTAHQLESFVHRGFTIKQGKNDDKNILMIKKSE